MCFKFMDGEWRSWRQYMAVLISALSVASAGTAYTWMEPLMLRMQHDFDLSPTQSSWLMSSVEIGELGLSIPVGFLADWYGRKWVLLSAGPLGIFAWSITLCSQSVWVLYIVRTLQGAVVAIAFGVLPLYIAEVSEPKVRGLLAGQFQAMWSFGILFTYLTGPYLSFNWYISVCAVMSLVFTALFVMMPETPYYYFMVEKNSKARKSLEWLRGHKAIDEELESIQKAVQKDMENKASWRDVFSTKKDRNIFFTVQFLCFIKNMIGSAAMSTNAADTFARVSNGALNENTATILFGSLLVGSALFGSFLSDTVGRRPIIIGTCLLIGIVCLITGVYFYLYEFTNYDMSKYSWVVYITVGASAVFANVGPSSLLQTVQGELFPSHTRAMGCALTGITASVASYLDLVQYQTVIDMFGHYMNFLIFAFFALCGALVNIFILKETAGKSLGEIQAERMEVKNNDAKERRL